MYTPPMTPESLDFQEEVRIVLQVRDYQRTRSFYEGVLGLEVLSQWDRDATDKGVVYRLGAAQLEVLLGDRSPVSRGVYAYVEVKDVDALWDRISRQVKVGESITTRPWGHRNFSVLDPNGFTIKFFSRR